MQPLLSIIVPIYNVEQYLDRCIQSILNQTYQNLEIILVDDGATDCSGVIADSYAAKDKRIKVFHKENGGLSDARNYGLDHVTGDYILFIIISIEVMMISVYILCLFNMINKLLQAWICYGIIY